jgi:PknH-like extracellular domain
MLAALCTLSPPASANVPPGKILSLIPSDDEVSQFMGVPMHHTQEPLAVRPANPMHLDQRDECRLLLFIYSAEVWGQDYSAFRAQEWADQSSDGATIVTQAVATFPDARAAEDHVNAVYNPNLFNTCNHAEFRASVVAAGLMLELYDFKFNHGLVAWTLSAKYQGRYTGWNAEYLALHVDNVMVISLAGQVGNPAPALTSLTDHILDRIG